MNRIRQHIVMMILVFTGSLFLNHKTHAEYPYIFLEAGSEPSLIFHSSIILVVEFPEYKDKRSRLNEPVKVLRVLRGQGIDVGDQIKLGNFAIEDKYQAYWTEDKHGQRVEVKDHYWQGRRALVFIEKATAGKDARYDVLYSGYRFQSVDDKVLYPTGRGASFLLTTGNQKLQWNVLIERMKWFIQRDNELRDHMKIKNYEVLIARILEWMKHILVHDQKTAFKDWDLLNSYAAVFLHELQIVFGSQNPSVAFEAMKVTNALHLMWNRSDLPEVIHSPIQPGTDLRYAVHEIYEYGFDTRKAVEFLIEVIDDETRSELERSLAFWALSTSEGKTSVFLAEGQRLNQQELKDTLLYLRPYMMHEDSRFFLPAIKAGFSLTVNNTAVRPIIYPILADLWARELSPTDRYLLSEIARKNVSNEMWQKMTGHAYRGELRIMPTMISKSHIRVAVTFLRDRMGYLSEGVSWTFQRVDPITMQPIANEAPVVMTDESLLKRAPNDQTHDSMRGDLDPLIPIQGLKPGVYRLVFKGLLKHHGKQDAEVTWYPLFFDFRALLKEVEVD